MDSHMAEDKLPTYCAGAQLSRIPWIIMTSRDGPIVIAVFLDLNAIFKSWCESHVAMSCPADTALKKSLPTKRYPLTCRCTAPVLLSVKLYK